VPTFTCGFVRSNFALAIPDARNEEGLDSRQPPEAPCGPQRLP
jgi:hypothetical protein